MKSLLMLCNIISFQRAKVTLLFEIWKKYHNFARKKQE